MHNYHIYVDHIEVKYVADGGRWRLFGRQLPLERSVQFVTEFFVENLFLVPGIT